MESLQNNLHAACVVDQKDLNETVVGAVAAVARQASTTAPSFSASRCASRSSFAAMALQGERPPSAPSIRSRTWPPPPRPCGACT